MDKRDRVEQILKRASGEDPAFPHGPSIKWPKVYQALRREGMDKSKAAAISNAHWNKYRRYGRAGAPGPRSAAEYEATRGRKARRRKGIPLPPSRQVQKHGSHDQSTHGNRPGLKLDRKRGVMERIFDTVAGRDFGAEIDHSVEDAGPLTLLAGISFVNRLNAEPDSPRLQRLVKEVVDEIAVKTRHEHRFVEEALREYASQVEPPKDDTGYWAGVIEEWWDSGGDFGESALTDKFVPFPGDEYERRRRKAAKVKAHEAVAAVMAEVAKHGSHDQSSHGNRYESDWGDPDRYPEYDPKENPHGTRVVGVRTTSQAARPGVATRSHWSDAAQYGRISRKDRDLLRRWERWRTMNPMDMDVAGVARAFPRRERGRLRELLNQTGQDYLAQRLFKAADIVFGDDDGSHFTKHYGPGPHKNGTPQSVHGSEARGTDAGSIMEKALSGGFTVSPITGEVPTSGYAVALPGYEERRPVAEVTEDWVREHRARAWSQFEDVEGARWGGWYDEESGEVFLDVSVVLDDREAAIELGRSTEQLAVADLGAINRGDWDSAFIDTGGRQRIAARFVGAS